MHDGDMLCTCMTLFPQSDHPIVFKFPQRQYVTILFNLNEQDSNMMFTKTSVHQTIYLV